ADPLHGECRTPLDARRPLRDRGLRARPLALRLEPDAAGDRRGDGHGADRCLAAGSGAAACDEPTYCPNGARGAPLPGHVALRLAVGDGPHGADRRTAPRASVGGLGAGTVRVREHETHLRLSAGVLTEPRRLDGLSHYP